MTNQIVTVHNETRTLARPLRLKVCSTFLSRWRGYLFSKAPLPLEGLLFQFKRASRIQSAIHMIGVGFPLGVLWLNDQKIVVDACYAQPWGLAYIPKRPAIYVIECASERLLEFKIGDKLQFME